MENDWFEDRWKGTGTAKVPNAQERAAEIFGAENGEKAHGEWDGKQDGKRTEEQERKRRDQKIPLDAPAYSSEMHVSITLPKENLK